MCGDDAKNVPGAAWRSLNYCLYERESKEGEKKISNTKSVVPAQDFVQSAFYVAVSRCQAVALSVSRKPVPCPAAQLALLKSTTNGKKLPKILAQSIVT